jgi:hypothetical protein
MKKIAQTNVYETFSGRGGMIKEPYPTVKLDIRLLRLNYQFFNYVFIIF